MSARWQNDMGVSDLSVAVDEIYHLRALLADEADTLRAHLDYKTFPKSRRGIAEEQIKRMISAASGSLDADVNAQLAFMRIDVDPTLTNGQWAEQRGLGRVIE